MLFLYIKERVFPESKMLGTMERSISRFPGPPFRLTGAGKSSATGHWAARRKNKGLKIIPNMVYL
jgi:hypothetical protein